MRRVHSKAARPKMREHSSPLNHMTLARSALKQQHQRGDALGLSTSRGLFYIAVPAWLSSSR
jgi:hypothetical protein